MPTPSALKKFKIIGVALYYRHAVNDTIMTDARTIAPHKYQDTNEIAKDVKKLINYMTTNTDSKINYSDSNMLLYLHSDASYLYEANPSVALAATSFLVPCLPIPSANRNHTIPCIPKMETLSTTATL